MKPKILVLGGSGYVGKEVVRELCRGGHAVRATYNVSAPGRVGKLADVEWVEVDLENSESIRSALQGCVAVIHAAGYEPKPAVTIAKARQHGVGELRRVLDACLELGVLRIVYVSSISTMNNGDLNRVYDETNFYTPGQFSDAYFEAKYSMEAELYRYFDKGLEIVVALPSLVLGPESVDSPARSILKRILKDSNHNNTSSEEDAAKNQRLNIVDVRDVAAAVVAAMERGRAGRRYALGGINTDAYRVRELFGQILDENSRTVDEFLGERAHAHFMAELADKVTGLCSEQIVQKLVTYVPGQLAASLGEGTGADCGTNLKTDKPRWYGVHVNSQRARGELGHRPRMLAQTIASSTMQSEGD